MNKLAKTQHLGHLTFFHSSKIIVIYEIDNFQNFPIFFLTMVQKFIKKENRWGNFYFKFVRYVNWWSSTRGLTYILESKVKHFQNCVTFWWHAKTHCLNMMSSILCPHNGATLGQFVFQNKPLYMLHWLFLSPRSICEKHKH
jgi:hypothetical protein